MSPRIALHAALGGSETFATAIYYPNTRSHIKWVASCVESRELAQYDMLYWATRYSISKRFSPGTVPLAKVPV